MLFSIVAKLPHNARNWHVGLLVLLPINLLIAVLFRYHFTGVLPSLQNHHGTAPPPDTEDFQDGYREGVKAPHLDINPVDPFPEDSEAHWDDFVPELDGGNIGSEKDKLSHSPASSSDDKAMHWDEDDRYGVGDTHSQWEGYSIKPVAYVFPQFHQMPENDKFWGVNFTEWDNVKKVTHNQYGLETLHPTEEVGYYNLLEYSTRARYAKLVKDSGIYGIVYHHYWFSDHAVMQKPLEAMLSDGQPDVPFMFSWANGHWTANLDDRKDDKILLEQTYGDINDWRRHFDWLLPYFRHPNYIRVGGRLQFVIHRPHEAGERGKRMYDSWRQWAVEEGLGGMDVIETTIEGMDPNEWGVPDAINEFSPQTAMSQDGTKWVLTDRLSKIYHRGVRVTWDNSPRHSKALDGTVDILAHPDTWRYHVLEVIRRMKLEPNPQGEENFLFINALNEWGDGNILEPSLQWGDRYWQSFRAAKEMGDKLPWKQDLVDASVSFLEESNSNNTQVDLCVLVRNFQTTSRWNSSFDVPQMLRSLQNQTNPQWRAVVFRAATTSDGALVQSHVLDTFDPRISFVDVPEPVVAASGPEGLEVTDWVINHLQTTSPSCSRAKYMLVADSSSTYHPYTFEHAAGESLADIVGLNFVSEATMKMDQKALPWDRRCTRFTDGSTPLCQPVSVRNGTFDIGATLIDLHKWKQEGLNVTKAGAAFLQQLVERTESPWSWAGIPKAADEDCNLVSSNTYPSCIRTGRFWLDVPDVNAQLKPGCHSLDTFTGSFGWDLEQWDMATYKENGFCMRMSEAKYDGSH